MKLRISETLAAALRNARNAANKQAKKSAWSAIRSAYSQYIPSGAKLGVEIDDATSDNYLALYVKGTDPHTYLTMPDAAHAPAATTGQFVTITPTAPTGRTWASIDRAALLQLLRDDVDEQVTYDPVLPAGFPTPASDDALVLDSSTGTLYFRS